MTRQSTLIATIAGTVILAYAAYIFYATSLAEKYGHCEILSQSAYPSPGSKMYAESVVRYCKQRGQMDAKVWLSSNDGSTSTVSVFSAALTTSESTIPKDWTADRLRVKWADDAALTVMFPGNMEPASMPNKVSGIAVKYIQDAR